jgi:NitT/TauT family transport system substrate-binding protein
MQDRIALVRIDRRTFVLGLVGLAGTAAGASVLAACGGSTTAGPSASGKPFAGSVAASNFTALPDWAPLHIAQEKGYFAKRKLEFTVLQLSQGADAIRAASSQTGLGAASTFSGVTGFDAGLNNLRIVANVLNGPGIVFLVRPDSGITSVQQLKKKKIGVQGETSLATYLGKVMIKNAGLNPSTDAEWINVGSVPNSQSALANKIVDCAFSLPPLSIVEVNAGRAKVLVDTRTIAPDLPQSSLFATQDMLTSNGDVVDRWIAAVAEGMKLIHDDVNAAAQSWGGKIGMDTGVALQTLQTLSTLFDTHVKKAGIDANIQAAKDLGLLKGSLTYEQIVPKQYRS